MYSGSIIQTYNVFITTLVCRYISSAATTVYGLNWSPSHIPFLSKLLTHPSDGGFPAATHPGCLRHCCLAKRVVGTFSGARKYDTVNLDGYSLTTNLNLGESCRQSITGMVCMVTDLRGCVVCV